MDTNFHEFLAVPIWSVAGWALFVVGLIGIGTVIYAHIEEIRAKRHLKRMQEEADEKRQISRDRIERKTIGSDPEDYPTEKMPRRRNYLP